MVTEKVQALLFRKKPRDFYDLYFLLRQRLGIEAILPYKKRLTVEVENLEARFIQRELKLFLPVSHLQDDCRPAESPGAGTPATLRSSSAEWDRPSKCGIMSAMGGK